MKVRISIPGASVSVEMEDARSRKVFSTLARELLIFGTGSTGEALPLPAVAKNMEPEESANPEEPEEKELPLPALQEAADPETDTEIPETEAEEYPEAGPGSGKYKGFMYIKCPECGKVKGFNMKKPTDHYHCDCCGERSEFKEPLVPLWVHCECGKGYKYLTNMEEPVFDINCLECGAPVTVQWNGKRRVYETIRR